jgi:hypothetical protein
MAVESRQIERQARAPVAPPAILCQGSTTCRRRWYMRRSGYEIDGKEKRHHGRTGSTRGSTLRPRRGRCGPSRADHRRAAPAGRRRGGDDLRPEAPALDDADSHDARSQGRPLRLTLPRPRGRLPAFLDERQEGHEGLGSILLERVEAPALPEAEGEVRRVLASGVRLGRAAGHPGSPAGAPRHRGVPADEQRALPLPRHRLRQGLLGRRRRGVCRDLPRRRPPHRLGALPLRERRPRLVLLRRGDLRRRRAPGGLLPAHGDHVTATRTEHGVVRPALPEPGHDAARRVRQPDRPTAPARGARARQHHLRR